MVLNEPIECQLDADEQSDYTPTSPCSPISRKELHESVDTTPAKSSVEPPFMTAPSSEEAKESLVPFPNQDSSSGVKEPLQECRLVVGSAAAASPSKIVSYAAPSIDEYHLTGKECVQLKLISLQHRIKMDEEGAQQLYQEYYIITKRAPRDPTQSHLPKMTSVEGEGGYEDGTHPSYPIGAMKELMVRAKRIADTQEVLGAELLVLCGQSEFLLGIKRQRVGKVSFGYATQTRVYQGGIHDDTLEKIQKLLVDIRTFGKQQEETTMKAEWSMELFENYMGKFPHVQEDPCTVLMKQPTQQLCIQSEQVLLNRLTDEMTQIQKYVLDLKTLVNGMHIVREWSKLRMAKPKKGGNSSSSKKKKAKSSAPSSEDEEQGEEEPEATSGAAEEIKDQEEKAAQGPIPSTPERRSPRVSVQASTRATDLDQAQVQATTPLRAQLSPQKEALAQRMLDKARADKEKERQANRDKGEEEDEDDEEAGARPRRSITSLPVSTPQPAKQPRKPSLTLHIQPASATGSELTVTRWNQEIHRNPMMLLGAWSKELADSYPD